MHEYWVFGLGICFGLVNATMAQENSSMPTVVLGAAATPYGGQNVFVVEQPKDAPNPLGNPIVVPEAAPKVFDTATDKSIGTAPQATMSPTASASPLPFSNNPAVQSQALGRDFQNTLLEANGRVYDVQSYPIQDFKLMDNSANPQTIYSPNVNN
jgi:hypothetical protein